MPFSVFNLAKVKKKFDLETSEDTDIFAAVVVEIDWVEYYLTDVKKILGILATGVRGS